MRRFLTAPTFLALLAVFFWLATYHEARAQEPKLDHWHLRDIIVGFDDPKDPDIQSLGITILEHDTTVREGRIRVRHNCWHDKSQSNGPHANECVYEWKFDKDITRLDSGAVIVCNLVGKRVDQFGERCPPGAWTGFMGLGTDAWGVYPTTLPKAQEVFSTRNAFINPNPDGLSNRVFPEKVNDRVVTAGTAELLVTDKKKTEWWGTFRLTIDSIGANISIQYIYEPVLVGQAEPPNLSGPNHSGKPPSGNNPSGNNPSGNNPSGNNPSGNNPSGSNPSGNNPSGNNPSGNGPGTVLASPPFGTPEPATSLSRMALEGGRRQVKKDKSVEVPIYLVKGDDVSNLNFEVRFDPSVVSFVTEPLAGSLLGATMYESKIHGTDLVKIGFAGTKGISGTGPVAVLDFLAVGQPGQKTPVTLSVTAINHPDKSIPPIDLIHGSVEILGDDVPLTALDAREALKTSVGKIPVNLRLDVNKDGQVTSLDATLILQTLNQR